MKPISRQRQWQIEQVRKGLCMLCLNPLAAGDKHRCEKHRAEHLVRVRKYYQKNREKCIERVKNWHKRNPDYQRNYQKTYQAEYRRVNREVLNAKQRAAYAARKAKAS